jgi:hypothetical protein
MICNLAFAQCQNKPYFTLYFEDAKGQHDTLIVGISPLACDSSLNAALGEFKISDVFADDLRFKVIGTKVKQDSTDDTHTYKAIFSKRSFFYVSPSEGGTIIDSKRCASLRQLMVLKCRVIDFPLKITIPAQGDPIYDGNYSPKFTSNGYFTSKNGGTIAAAAFGLQINPNGTLILQQSDLGQWPNSNNDYFLFFSIRHIIVSNKELAIPTTLQVFPNPSTNYLQFNSADVLDGLPVLLYNATGTLLATKTINHNEISTIDLPVGLITGVVRRKDKPTAIFRFLQMK